MAAAAVVLAVVALTLTGRGSEGAPHTAAGPDGAASENIAAGPRDRFTDIAQPAAFVYSGDPSGALDYAQPGGLVVAGRDNFQDPVFQEVSEGRGTVLVYLDPVIRNPYGPYHELMFEDSSCGPAVPEWPGSPANSWGTFADFRRGGVLQGKLACVLETMVQENPHMGGWFVDDLGSRPYGTDYEGWSPREKQAYYDGAVAISQVFRDVADKYGLIFIANGSWDASSRNSGGGYPDARQHGNSLADGGVIEHHDGQQEFFGPYGCSPQWAADSPSSAHHPIILTISRSDADRDIYARTECVTHAVNQNHYLDPPPPWGPFRDIGLPSEVAEP